ncbi:hypothetical protein, partial [Streptomyces afghaniensis]|uniref:hypothetical protein n=1 Tax=Streptomyces afghaniensis TaxID=66865 RepID=UPI0024692BF6
MWAGRSPGAGPGLGCLGCCLRLAVAGRRRGRLAGDLAVRRLLLARLAVRRGRGGRGRYRGAAGR